MFYELKSNSRDKIFIFMLLFSVIISSLSFFSMDNRIRGENYELYYFYQTRYYSQKSYIENQKLYTSSMSDLKLNLLAYNDWMADNYFRLSELYKDGYEKNEDEIRSRKAQEFYFSLLMGDNRPLSNTDSIDYFYKLNEYLDFDISFDLEMLREYMDNEISQEFSKAQYSNSKQYVDRFLYLKESNLEEVDFNTLNPWTFIGENYGVNTLKSGLLIPLMILFSNYLILKSRNKRELNLLSLMPKKRSKLVFHYFVSNFILVFIIVFLPDIIICLLLGITNGFKGINNPILIFKEGLKSFSTYKNVGEFYQLLGFAKLYPTEILQDYNYFMLADFLENIKYYQFLILSFIPDALKIVFFTFLGGSIALCIENKLFSAIVSSFITLFTILSISYDFLHFSFNIFSIKSGYDITLGWTNISWFGANILLITGIIVVYFFSIILFSKKEIGE